MGVESARARSDAQLTTEIFGLFAPARPDVALRMVYLPIRTTEVMADNGLLVIDRVVLEEMGGVLDSETNSWLIPVAGEVSAAAIEEGHE